MIDPYLGVIDETIKKSPCDIIRHQRVQGNYRELNFQYTMFSHQCNFLKELW